MDDKPKVCWKAARLLGLVLAVMVLSLLPCLTRPGHTAAPPAYVAADEEPDGEPTDYAGNPISLMGTTDEVFSVSISPDGSRIAAGTGSFNRPGRVDVWDFRTRKLLWSAEEMRGVSSVVFSHDSKRLGWGGWGGLVRVEQLEPRRPVFRVPLFDSNHCLAFSADGKWLALAGENRSLRLLDAATGKLLATPKGDSLAYFCVRFSHSGKVLAAGGGTFNKGNAGGPNQVNLFDVASHKQIGKLTGHTLAVINVAFSPRDELIATSSADNTIRVWDGTTFQHKLQLRGHSAGVKGLVFSPDGSLLASGSWDRTVRLWDPTSGKQLAQLDGHPGVVRQIDFSPDGKYLVSGGGRRSVKVWDVKQRKLLATLQEDPEPVMAVPLLTMAVAPDGKVVATGDENGQVLFRDTRTGVIRRTLAAHEDAVTALAFSSDSKYLASSGPDMIVKLWDANSGKLLHALKGHTSWVYALTFSPDGKKLASGSYDRTVRVWDPQAGQAVGTLTGHTASVRALAFSPDGTMLASGGADQKVRLWDLRTMKRGSVFRDHEGGVRGLAFSPDGQLLLSAGEDGQLIVWDVVKGERVGKPRTGLGEVVSLTLSRGGRTVILGNQAGNITIADGRTGLPRRTFFGHNQGVLAVALGLGGSQLFSMGSDGLVKIWRGSTGPIRILDGHTGTIRVAIFSPDGKYLLSCGGWPEGDRTLRLWDVKSGKQVRLLYTAQTQLQSAAFSPDGKYAVAGEDRGIIHLFEVETGKEVRTLQGHKGGIHCLTFSGDGKQLLSACSDKTVRLWDAGNGEAIRIFKGHTNWARCAIFHPDGKHILSGGRDKIIRVWDRETGDQVKKMDHGNTNVERLVVLSDRKRFLSCTGSGGGPMRLWELETGKLLRTYNQPGSTTGLAVTKDGRRAFSTGYGGTVRMWDVESGAELQRFEGHRNWVWSVEVSPDGKTFVTAGGGRGQAGKYAAGEDFTIRVWKMPAAQVAQVR
jgi:WD40 repeat protein